MCGGHHGEAVSIVCRREIDEYGDESSLFGVFDLAFGLIDLDLKTVSIILHCIIAD